MDPISRAQKTPQKRRKTGFGRTISPDIGKATQFQPGNRANPGGRPKKLRITEMYEKLLDDPKNVKRISGNVLKTLTHRGMAGVLLLREVTERTEGKVSDDVNVNVSGTISLAQVIEERRKKRQNGNGKS